MRAAINALALTGAVVAALLTLNLLIGFSTGYFDPTTGRSTANMQLIALIAAVLAIAFGFMGRMRDRRMPRPASKLSDGAIAAGLVAGLLVLALPFVFG
ncbi:MAG: hypothetical protein WBG08_07190 [Litorimonas sp.]